ncbi:MAG: SpoIIE family protein phosphatase [bacterium]|nr:SpoIIE family protein phosphatase [bacterium]
MVQNKERGNGSLNNRWRDLVDSYLSSLIQATGSEFACYVDQDSDRERYVFASKESPLPNINWHKIIDILTGTILHGSDFIVIEHGTVEEHSNLQTLDEHFKSGLFKVIVVFSIQNEDVQIGTVCLFGTSADMGSLIAKKNTRNNIEALTGVAKYALEVVKEAQDGPGRKVVRMDAFRQLPEGLLMADRTGKVIESNDAFSNLTGIPASMLIGRNLKDQPILGTDCDYLIARLLENGQPFEVIANLGTGEGQAENVFNSEEQDALGKFLRLRGTSYPGEDGNSQGMLLLADDVTGDVMARREANRRAKRHSQEINLASCLQQNFFPPGYQKKRVRIATRLLAARELAGDFFDIFDLGPNTIGVVIGDVVGKGIPSSLMAMSVHGMLANQAGALTPPKRVLERVNEGLHHQVKGEYWYATCFYAKIHVTQLRVTYSHAGHELPLWWHNDTNEVTFIQGEGLPLGIFPDSHYYTNQIDLSDGDRLLLYTDGLTDAVNSAGERFGHDRLIKLFKKYSSLGSKNLLRVIENEILDFNSGRELQDDIAIALISIVPDNWTTLTIPPYTFIEVIGNLLDELSMKGVDEDTVFKARLSLDECVNNAFRHGHHGDHRRQITISYLIEPNKCTMKVRDQGPGFDFGMIPDPTLEENLLQPGGRGVFLTLKMMDEVSFNDVGNEVTMVKFLHTDS